METNAAPPTQPLTQDDRMMAALAHVGIIVPMIGIFIPIVIWVTQKGKSTYVAFQALQALVYQILLVLVWFVGMACYMGSFIPTFLIGLATSGSKNPSPADLMFLLPVIIFAVIGVVAAIYILFGLVGTVQALRGKEFRYPWLGSFLERRLDHPAA